jgi:hypothetical protein
LGVFPLRFRRTSFVGAASGISARGDSGLTGAFTFCFPFAFFVGLQGVGVDCGGGGFSGAQYSQMVTSRLGVPCITFCSYEPSSIIVERNLSSPQGAISLGVNFIGFVCPRLQSPEASGSSHFFRLARLEPEIISNPGGLGTIYLGCSRQRTTGSPELWEAWDLSSA